MLYENSMTYFVDKLKRFAHYDNFIHHLVYLQKMKINKNLNRKRLGILILSIFIILLCLAIFIYFNIQNKHPSNSMHHSASNTQVQTKSTNPTIHFAAMGDMLAHDTIIDNAKTPDGYDFSKYFTNIESSYKGSDIIFCNQEGLSSGEQYGISGYPAFNAPTQFSNDLRNGAGCNLINLANNHIGDKGVSATDATIDVWSKLKPLAFSGANKNATEQSKLRIFTVNGIKVGFVSFADFNNNNSTPAYSVNNYHDEALVRKLVSGLRGNADVVIVSMHWGIEDSNAVSSDQQNETNLLSSLGADVIIGTGPHVLQKVSVIPRKDGGKTIVWYSLGNMLSSQLLIKELIGGIATFDITKTGGKITIGKLSFTPTYMHYDWTQTQAANNDLLARKNAMIYLLKNASIALSKSLFNTTVQEQKQYVIDTLGSEVAVK